MVDPSYATPPQFASELGCKPDTVRAMIKAGKILAFRVGLGTKRPRLRIPWSELAKLENSYEPETTEKLQRRRTPKPADSKFVHYY